MTHALIRRRYALALLSGFALRRAIHEAHAARESPREENLARGAAQRDLKPERPMQPQLSQPQAKLPREIR